MVVFLREVIGLFILMFGRLFDCGRCVGWLGRVYVFCLFL